MFAVINFGLLAPCLIVVCAVLITAGISMFDGPSVEDNHGLDANGMPEDQDTIEERVEGYA